LSKRNEYQTLLALHDGCIQNRIFHKQINHKTKYPIFIKIDAPNVYSLTRLVSTLPTVAGSVVQGVLRLRAVLPVLGDLGGRVVAVVNALERQEILRGNIGNVGVVEVNGVRRRITVHPSVIRQGVQPVVVVGSVDGAAAFVVAAAGLRGEGDAAGSLLVPLVQQVLLGGSAERGVDGDVVVDRLGGADQIVRRPGLQVASGWAMDPVWIQGFESVTHGVQLRNNLTRQATCNALFVAAALAAKDAGGLSGNAALKVRWTTAVAGNRSTTACTSLLARTTARRGAAWVFSAALNIIGSWAQSRSNRTTAAPR
jgi:hypothetical protein